ncbi:hypothetical protein Pmani_007510 [Petrolisthes manimaculis]|uniref:Protein kinase domain-containing protein n=1 Tax=Petrolisthes manimaculis TaxID=1843537 RepID=A0AAE1Q8A5_9EUCA|nr:hypothetical protein Pmani_007510 [Petrolisthes manimaculis]
MYRSAYQQEFTTMKNKLLTADEIRAEVEEVRPLVISSGRKCYLVLYRSQQAIQKIHQYTNDPEALRYEAWALEKVGGRGGVPKLLVAATDAPMLVMSCVEGESISCLHQREERLSLKEWLKIFQAAATSLAQVHEAGLIHHNIHGGNILVKEEEGGCYSASIIELGLACLGGTQTISNNATQDITNTLEMVSSDNKMDRYDVYSLGLLMSAIMITPECPSIIRQLIKCTIHHNVNRRPTMASLASSLQRCVEELDNLSTNPFSSCDTEDEDTGTDTEDDFNTDTEDDFNNDPDDFNTDTQDDFNTDTEDDFNTDTQDDFNTDTQDDFNTDTQDDFNTDTQDDFNTDTDEMDSSSFNTSDEECGSDYATVVSSRPNISRDITHKRQRSPSTSDRESETKVPRAV